MELVEGDDFLGYVHKAGTPRVTAADPGGR